MNELYYGVASISIGIILLIFLSRRESMHEIRSRRFVCDDSCHGSKDNYIYRGFEALEVGHALEQRVAELENKLWWENTEQLLMTFDDLRKIPMQNEKESRQEYYFRIKKFKRFYNCKKCPNRTDAIRRQECICIEIECNNRTHVMENSDLITHPLDKNGSYLVSHNQYEQTDCGSCLTILENRIKERNEQS